MNPLFYSLTSSKDWRERDFAKIADESRPTPWTRCPANPEHDHGGWYDPLVLDLPSAPRDFVYGWGTGGPHCSADVKGKIEGAGLSGVRFRELTVQASYRGKREVLPYFDLEPM